MFYNAKNENIQLDGTDCDYISFGTGKENLIMLPGVGDGFKTARGIAVPFAFMYSGFAQNFKVYVFSRRNVLPEDFSTADMADDIDKIMDMIGIKSASVFGVSQGGMISQQLAIRHPERVKKLVLAVTASRPNELMKEALESWIKMAESDDYAGIMLDTAKRSYTGKYLERGIKMNSLLAKMKPKDYSRFITLCRSCLSHDVYDMLQEISCPTFIVGADKDLVLGGEASIEMHDKINGSTLYMYEGYSHGVYEQAKDFNGRILDYLTAL
ncbi:alpha/beta fold hydrolase [Butyrivibrio sp. AE3006]|uniref:alpha/beta fold hydrolase n=1 Tax=Butyrivibrio sp. AE3006 TaxID=1280673 RepID=UPI000405D4FF|nr:alpha/beta hydrolase [Butyrivibrio sp. AE3006]